jgi:hypothetical protein
MEKKPQPIKLFYCYARNDRALRDELDKHLAGLHRSGLITAWYDGAISPVLSGSRKLKLILIRRALFFYLSVLIFFTPITAMAKK